MTRLTSYKVSLTYLEISQTFIEQEMVASSVVVLVLLLLLPGLVHHVVVVVNVGVVALQLVQLDVDDPLLVLLGVLVLAVSVVLPPLGHLLLLHHPGVQHGVPGGVDGQPGDRVGVLLVPEGLVVVSVVPGVTVPEDTESVDMAGHQVSLGDALVSSLCNGDGHQLVMKQVRDSHEVCKCMEANLMPLRHCERQEIHLVDGFGCLELCLYGIRKLQHHDARIINDLKSLHEGVQSHLCCIAHAAL